MKLKRILFCSIVLFAANTHTIAQATKINNDPDSDFKLAKELYDKHQFNLAYPLFTQLSIKEGVYKGSNFPVSAALEAKYYSIACSLQLNDETAVANAKTFIESEHNAPRTQLMSYSWQSITIAKKILQMPLPITKKPGLII